MRALIAMSGGVDSSVAALMIKNMGYECIGCTMKLYDTEDADIKTNRTCCSLDDVEDARSVAKRLGMDYYVFNFKEDFKKKIIDKFIFSYQNAITPNPCIDCNRYMKFDKLFERAKILGCDYVVTGHYAIIEKEGEKYVLKKALDESKDQSYVLYSMTQKQLAHTLFPLGALSKAEVRKIADENGFVNAAKPDSQDICFVPDGDYAEVIEKYTNKSGKEGNFIDMEGKIIGTHRGIINYTIGQRKGLGISGSEPYYVCRIDAKNNTVTLGKNSDLFSKEALVGDFNWISGEPPVKKVRCKAKIRYRHKEQSAYAAIEGDRVKIVFDEPQRAITPGQAAVLYDEDKVLGGGVII